MTREESALIAASWEAAAPVHDEIVRRFYEVLLQRHPELKPMFAHSDMNAQREKFVGMIDEIIALREEPHAIVRRAVALSRRHVGYGVQRAHYAPAGSALLTALADVLGPSFTPDVRSAWSAAYELISAIMRRAASRLDTRHHERTYP